MSLTVVLAIIDRAVCDLKYCQLLFEEPLVALEGYDLTPEEAAQFMNLTPENWDAFIAQDDTVDPDGNFRPGTGG